MSLGTRYVQREDPWPATGYRTRVGLEPSGPKLARSYLTDKPYAPIPPLRVEGYPRLGVGSCVADRATGTTGPALGDVRACHGIHQLRDGARRRTGIRSVRRSQPGTSRAGTDVQ